jgi:hypothetical protein
MPRGNDAEAATKELVEQGYGNMIATELLAAHAELHPAELKAAQLRRTDDSVEIDLKSIKPDNKGDTVCSAAKKGDQVIYVAERPDGSLYKGLVDFADVRATATEGESKAKKSD